MKEINVIKKTQEGCRETSFILIVINILHLQLERHPIFDMPQLEMTGDLIAVDAEVNGHSKLQRTERN